MTENKNDIPDEIFADGKGWYTPHPHMYNHGYTLTKYIRADLAQPRAVEKVEGLEENDPNTLIKALRFFSEFVRLDDRTQPYFVRQEEKHHLMALIKAARIVAAQQKKAVE